MGTEDEAKADSLAKASVSARNEIDSIAGKDNRELGVEERWVYIYYN